MKNVYDDDRIVMTLDAGGTNFVFSALQRGREMFSPIVHPAHAENLEACLKTIITGFKQVRAQVAPQKPVAISFAFPGPADYKNGVIGDLPNFPSFRGGVALGPMLEEIFGIPTLINNDGDLFTYGEAVGGLLPEINSALEQQGSSRKYTSLFGVTLGTGFGGGLVINNKLVRGDNAAAGEIWLTRNFLNRDVIAEEHVSIRAIQRNYNKLSKTKESLSPEEIFTIAKGESAGDKDAALGAFDAMAIVVAESLAHVITLLDCPVVIGGGISGASGLLFPRIEAHLNGSIQDLKGNKMSRLVSQVFNLEDKAMYKKFMSRQRLMVDVPFSKTGKKVSYYEDKLLAMGKTRLGTSFAVCLGAYALAIDALDNRLKKTLHAHGDTYSVDK